MTSLICWVGVDSRGPASVYLASDSRISWKDPTAHRIWDVGRKLFAPRTSPEVLGYVGQVLFPSQVLSQVIDLIDARLLFPENASPEWKRGAIFSEVRRHFDLYPVDRNQIFTIVYATRHSLGMRSTFHVATLSWEPQSQWKEESLETPSVSQIVKAWGSGQAAVDRWYDRWLSTRQGGRTSRSVFSAFCDALASGEDSFTGGAPQLVGLYRQGAAQMFGVVFNGARYVFGVPITDPSLAGALEWRNAVFERCDGLTGLRLVGAQVHTRPRGLAKALGGK